MLVFVKARPKAAVDADWAHALSAESVINTPGCSGLDEAMLWLWRLKTVEETGGVDEAWKKHTAAWLACQTELLFIQPTNFSPAMVLRLVFQGRY